VLRQIICCQQVLIETSVISAASAAAPPHAGSGSAGTAVCRPAPPGRACRCVATPSTVPVRRYRPTGRGQTPCKVDTAPDGDSSTSSSHEIFIEPLVSPLRSSAVSALPRRRKQMPAADSANRQRRHLWPLLPETPSGQTIAVRHATMLRGSPGEPPSSGIAPPGDRIPMRKGLLFRLLGLIRCRGGRFGGTTRIGGSYVPFAPPGSITCGRGDRIDIGALAELRRPD